MRGKAGVIYRIPIAIHQPPSPNLVENVLTPESIYERRPGKLMAAQREAGAISNGGEYGHLKGKGGLQENLPSADAPITLSEVGIDKNLADRARKYAVPVPDFRSPRERAKCLETTADAVLDLPFPIRAEGLFGI